MPEGFHNGYKIPPFVPGDRERTPQSAAAMNELVRALNVLLNPKIQRGTSDSDVISEAGHVITLKANDGGAGGGPPFITGTQPLAPDGGIGWILVDDENNNEVNFGGQFATVKFAYIFNGTLAGVQWIKRTSIARAYYNLYPDPIAWFLYNSNWVDPQPFG